MVTDARGHEVPADSDMWGYREDMGLLSASIADVRSVANQADAEAAIADLEASDLDPSGTVWWLATPGALYVYDGTALVELAGKAEVAEQIATLTEGLADLTDHGFVAIDSGYIDFPGVGGNGGTKSATVNFAKNRFSLSPIPAGPLGQQRISWTLSSVSTTSMVLTGVNFTGIDAPTARTRWVAVQSAAPARAQAFSARSAGALALDDDTLPQGTVTCPTTGCPNFDVPVQVTTAWIDETGVEHPVDVHFCGPCGTDITDTLVPLEEGS